jgi:hypothetical protein
VEPVTLALVGTTVLTQGIKFLYAQAGEAISRWRQRRAEPIPVPPNAPLEGTLEPAKVDPAAMERLESDIVQLRRALSPYLDDAVPEPVDTNNANLIDVTDGLRRSLEAKGEAGKQSGPLVEGEVDVDDVLGYVAGVRARSIEGGQVKGTAKAKRVGPGGELFGVDADRIG